MRVLSLGVEDFRNFHKERVEFGSGLTLVVGRNAQGKTNLLEAVHCLSGLGSPRAADALLIREGGERAVLVGEVISRSSNVTVGLELRAGRRSRALVNGTAVPSAGALSDVIVSVFFGPDDLSVVKGPPDVRRRFLDDLVVKLRPLRAQIRAEWERVLRQRNALLRSLPSDRHARTEGAATLEVWNEALCRIGGQLTSMRLETLSLLRPYAQKRYEALAGGGELDLAYASAWLDADSVARLEHEDSATRDRLLQAALHHEVSQVLNKEMERGTTLTGPHRDDVAVRLASNNGEGELLDARSFASQGDQRSAALALKLGEFDLLSDALGEEPVLLLDDVFSELDPSRREWLSDAVRATGQTIVSSAEPDAIGATGPDAVKIGRAHV